MKRKKKSASTGHGTGTAHGAELGTILSRDRARKAVRAAEKRAKRARARLR